MNQKSVEEQPTFIYDFPITQAALARIRQDNTPVAERFEIYFKGMELANGFHELTDAKEQEQRFIKDQPSGKKLLFQKFPLIIYFWQLYNMGSPESCAGIALGIID